MKKVKSIYTSLRTIPWRSSLAGPLLIILLAATFYLLFYEQADYVIFSSGDAVAAMHDMRKNDSSVYWSPTRGEAFEANAVTKEYLERLSPDDLHAEKNAFILRNFSTYHKQFVGYIGEGGDSFVFINYLLIDNSSQWSHWRKKVVVIYDGGPRFFKAEVNLSKRRCVGVYINGGMFW